MDRKRKANHRTENSKSSHPMVLRKRNKLNQTEEVQNEPPIFPLDDNTFIEIFRYMSLADLNNVGLKCYRLRNVARILYRIYHQKRKFYLNVEEFVTVGLIRTPNIKQVLNIFGDLIRCRDLCRRSLFSNELRYQSCGLIHFKSFGKELREIEEVKITNDFHKYFKT